MKRTESYEQLLERFTKRTNQVLVKRNNFTIFRDRIKTNGKFTISEGNGQKIQITQKFAYEFNTIQDLERFKR